MTSPCHGTILPQSHRKHKKAGHHVTHPIATPAIFPAPPAPPGLALPPAAVFAGAGQQSVPQHTSTPRLHAHVTCFGRVPSANCSWKIVCIWCYQNKSIKSKWGILTLFKIWSGVGVVETGTGVDSPGATVVVVVVVVVGVNWKTSMHLYSYTNQRGRQTCCSWLSGIEQTISLAFGW